MPSTVYTPTNSALVFLNRSIAGMQSNAVKHFVQNLKEIGIPLCEYENGYRFGYS